MILFSSLFAWVLFHVAVTLANVEKTIFLAPGSVNIPNVGPGFEDLNLIRLNPIVTTLRTRLPRAFPSAVSKGNESWYLLEDLNPGQRYEVRVCWPANQPTKFWVDTYLTSKVFDTPNLIQALAEFAESQDPRSGDLLSSQSDQALEGERAASLLFLRIIAAADYFTTNQTLMNSPPSVDVDIILDPYLLNVLPQSLVQTGSYLIILTACSWFLSDYIWKWISKILREEPKPHAD